MLKICLLSISSIHLAFAIDTKDRNNVISITMRYSLLGGGSRLIYQLAIDTSLDTVQTRFQVSKSSATHFNILSSIYKEENLKGFYRELKARMAIIFLKATYQNSLITYLTYKKDPNQFFLSNICLAGTLACMDTLTLNFFERWKVYSITSAPYYVKGDFYNFQTRHTNFIKESFKGASASFGMSFLSWSVFFCLEEKMRHILEENHPNHKLFWYHLLFVGGTAGLIDSLLTQPFQVAKNFVQQRKTLNENTIALFVRLYRTHGTKVLFREFSLDLIQATFSGTIDVVLHHVVEQNSKKANK